VSGKKQNVKENEKVMTKYDRKLQKRKEELEKAKKEALKHKIITIIAVAVLGVFLLSFPVRTYMGTNGTYIKVGDEKVTRLEFDIYYNSIKQNYISQMSYYLSLLGISDTNTLEKEAYDETMTYGDYFAQLTAESIVEQKGVAAKAAEAGFVYDTSEEIKALKENLEMAAADAGVTLKAYIKAVYGSLATWDRIKPFLEKDLYVSAYYDKVLEDNIPSEEAIQIEYESKPENYDVVDYHMLVVEAELPTANPDGTVEKDENGNEIAYEPTEEEIAAAMKDAYKKAQAAVDTVTSEGTVYEGVTVADVSADLYDFMSDANRKVGDTTIIELADTNRYWVVSFDGRYLDETPTHDIRCLITSTRDGQALLEEWKAGEATEESFAELAALYDESGSGASGGLYTGVAAADMDAELAEWLSGDRMTGDTVSVTAASGETYIMYYIAKNDPAWKLEAENALMTEYLAAFIEEATMGIEVEDPKGKLVYLQKNQE